jgi:hypothetical protein
MADLHSRSSQEVAPPLEILSPDPQQQISAPPPRLFTRPPARSHRQLSRYAHGPQYFQRMLAPKFSINLSTWGTTSPRDAIIQHFSTLDHVSICLDLLNASSVNNVGVAVFLVGLKAGGVALNLTEVSRVYLTDSR